MPNTKTSSPDPIQVAILGGGPASLAAAYHLTTQEPGRYQITVYEMSWRLGGKTASGRGPHGRIEEHGLHILFGGYHNTFDLMTGCYQAARAECGPHATPFPRFLDAVEPGNYGVIGDDRTQPWRPWPLQFPMNRGVPGDAPLPRTSDLVSGLLQLLIHVILGARVVRAWQRLLARPGPLRDPRPHPTNHPDGGDACLHRLIIPAFRAALNPDRWAGRVVERVTRLVQWTLHRSERLLISLSPARLPPRIWTALDLVLATVLGLARDRVLVRPDGYERLDDIDLRAWLRRHGCREETLDSPLARVVYEATFQGFFTEQVAAGAALRILLWMALTYKGSMYYRMKGATGDIINVPLYLLLKQRGVKFAFFHRVKALRTSHDAHGQPVIDSIELERLARPRTGDEYEPTVVVDGDHCWPSEPILDRLDPDGHQDAQHAEDPYHRGRAVTPVRLRRRIVGSPTDGATFDQIIFGIPVACIPLVAAELVEEGRSRWARQSEIVATPTVALQLWCKPSLAELGWREPSPLLSLFWDPMNTWCDMSQTLAREPWTGTGRPTTVAYFCGPLFLDNLGVSQPDLARLEPTFDRVWRAHCDAQARRARTDLLHRLHELWPAIGGSATPSGPAPFHHNVLFDPDNGKDEARLAAQYLRSNHDPHARCTLALPGQTALRMRADETGYANLIVAGDWTANEILVPCLEGAVQSGIRAARALSQEKHRYRIVGEALLTPGRRLDPPSVPGPGRSDDPNDDSENPPARRKRAPHAEVPQLEL